MNDWEELNGYLRECCIRERDRVSSGQTKTIGERFEEEKAPFLSGFLTFLFRGSAS
jgi:hypothetical protein